MITLPNGKICMNEQEAIQWLLNNNALPFQCTANYVAGAEIGLGTIVNPSPAKVRVGSLIFFADSKVSTVIAITSNSFICSDEYNDLVDDIVYVSNVAINASGHLIVTLSNGTNIDAGLIKQVTGFSINESQHLIATFNDGSTTDLGAIFNGSITISGDITATGTISAPNIIEDMANYYSYNKGSDVANLTFDIVYAGVVKNGNKVTFVQAIEITRTGTVGDGGVKYFGTYGIPYSVGSKLYPAFANILQAKKTTLIDGGLNTHDNMVTTVKNGDYQIYHAVYGLNDLTLNTKYYLRVEETYLLSDNLAA